MANSSVLILSDIEVTAGMSLTTNYTGFPENPAPRTMAVVDGMPYIWTELTAGTGYFSWVPIGAKPQTYLHTQGVAASEWIVTHNLSSNDFGYFVYDSNHNLVFANSELINRNKVKIKLSSAMTGTAVFFSVGFSSSSSDGVVGSGSGVNSDVQTALDGKVDKVAGKGLSSNDYTLSEKTYVAAVPDMLTTVNSLHSVATSGDYNSLFNKPAAYSLPTASNVSLGGVKIDDSTITISNGIISATQYSLPTASNSVIGGVKIDGNSISIGGDGTIVANTAYKAPYDIATAISGSPSAGSTVLMMAMPRAVTIPANSVGSVAKSITAATATSAFVVKVNGNQVATFTFAAGGTSASFSSQSAISVSAGDILSIIAPASKDSTLADIAISIAANLS